MTHLELKAKDLSIKDDIKSFIPLSKNIQSNELQSKHSLSSNFVNKKLIAVGKSKRLVNQEHFLNENVSKTKINLVEQSLSLPDLVRARAGSFWSITNNLPLTNQSSISDIAFGINIKKSEQQIENTSNVYGQFITNIDLVSNKALFKFNLNESKSLLEETKEFNSEFWKLFISNKFQPQNLLPVPVSSSQPQLNITLATTPLPFAKIPIFTPTINEDDIYFDHVFELNVPFSKKEYSILNADIGSLFIDVNPTYNFFSDSYEDVISKKNVHETILPEMYVFLSELHSERNKVKNSIFKKHITLSKKIQGTFTDITNNSGEIIGVKDKGEYFDKYSVQLPIFLNDLKNEFGATYFKNKFKNQVFPISEINILKDFNDKRFLFPMFFDITFSTDNSTQFAQILQDTSLNSILIKDLMEDNIKSENLTFQDSTIHIKQKNGKFIERSVLNAKSSLRTWDILKWVDDLSKNVSKSFSDLNSGIFIGSVTNETKIPTSPQFNFFKNLMVLIFKGKLKTIISNHLRSYNDMIHGKLSYSENVFYRIEKIAVDSNEVIQNFYIPNSADIDILKFVDTQVKYNKQYKYKIFVYQMVLGNKYRYKTKVVESDFVNVDVVNEPSLKLVEVLFYEFTGRILDAPPVPPEVNIIPYKGINNKLLFHFNSSLGRYNLHPVFIEKNDKSFLQDIREAQMLDENEPVLYKTDDVIARFEIFRIDKKPLRISDFEGKRITSVSTKLNSMSINKVSSAAFIDDIIPNKKYYYVFRGIDNHGHISNPTSVFQVEMVDDNGSIYPIIEVVDFKKNIDLQSPTKGMKKFIQIVPSFNQKVLNEQKSGLVINGDRIPSALNIEQVHLGVADETVWGKRFRMRLTSKKTGKKIDFNIMFDHKHLKKGS